MGIVSTLSKGIRPYILIILMVFAYATLPALRVQPLDRDESRYMQATTQMFESKDFVRISFQDEPRNKKPVGIHWLQAISLEAFHQETDRNPFTFRLVSILGACLAACAVCMTGNKLFSPEVGFIAGLGMATTLLLSTEAHIAKTDATMTGFIALAFYALAAIRFGDNSHYSSSRNNGGNLFNSLLFWFSFGMAVLIKGPVPLMIIGLAIIVFSLWERDAKWQKSIWDWRGIILFLAMVLPWFILIGLKTDWQFYIDAVSQDLTPKLSGHAETKSTPPGLHLLISPILLWPSSILMGLALWVSFARNYDPKVRFLLAWLIPAWLVFELSPAKLAHYTMPLHGAILLLGAYGLFEHGFKGFSKWIGVFLFTLGSAIVVALPFFLAKEYAPKMMQSALLLSAIIGMSAISTLLLFVINSKNSVIMAVFTGLLFAILFKAQFLPNVAAFDVSRRISNELVEMGIHPRLSHQGHMPALVGAGYQEPSLIFLTRSDSHLDSVDNAVKYAKPNAPAIIEDKLKSEFQQKLAHKGLRFVETANKVSGVNYSKGDDVVIHIGTIAKK